MSGRLWAHLELSATRQRKVTPEQKEYARREVARGRTQADVRRELGISAPYMHRIAKGA